MAGVQLRVGDPALARERRGGHRAAVQLAHPRAEPRAGGEAEPQAVAGAPRGAAQEQSCAAGVTCSRRSAGEAANPPVARTHRGARQRASAARPSRISPASAATIEPVSNRRPTVRGLPVSRWVTTAPRASSQSRSPSSRSNTSRWSSGIAARALGAEPSRTRGGARRRRRTSASPRRRTSPFSSCSTSAPRSRASAAAASPAMPAPATDEVGPLTPARSWACARRTRP